MNNDKIIQKIKTENLKPISRNTFLLRRFFIWFCLVITTIFGAYAFAFFFLKTLFIDFDNWRYFENSYDNFLIKNIPIIWILWFFFSLFMISFLFKKTNSGYRYSIVFIGSISLLISFFLGLALAKTLSGTGLLVDRFENERIISWTNPKSGRLSGEILFVNEDYVLIRDITDDIWNVDTSYLLDNSKEVLLNNSVISVVGRYDYEHNFTACQIIPLNMDKNRFAPNPNKKFNPVLDDGFDLVREVCDFVINQNR